MTKDSHYLYVFEMLGYAKHGHPKVGITKNVKKREKQLWYSYGGLIPKLIALYQFDNILAARSAELDIIKRFTPYLPPAREIFVEPCSDVIEYISRASFDCIVVPLP